MLLAERTELAPAAASVLLPVHESPQLAEPDADPLQRLGDRVSPAILTSNGRRSMAPNHGKLTAPASELCVRRSIKSNLVANPT